MTTALQAAEFRVPGALVRAMADFLLKIRPGLSRTALARHLRDRLASRGVHYNERTIRRQLNGAVSSVPRLLEREMRSLILEMGDLDEESAIENNKRVKIPAEHVLYPKHRAAGRKIGGTKRRSSQNEIDGHARHHGADVLDTYLHEIGTLPRLSRERE